MEKAQGFMYSIYVSTFGREVLENICETMVDIEMWTNEQNGRFYPQLDNVMILFSPQA